MKDYYGSGMSRWMTSKEYDKNYMRVNDIMKKANGDIEKAKKLAQTQADRISVDNKAISRYRVAKHEGFDEIAEVFMHRAYTLGEVDTQTYREWQIDNLFA